MPVAPLVAGWDRQFPGSSAAAGSAGAAGAGPALSAVYDPAVARVRLTATGLPYNTTRVELWRYRTTVLTNPAAVRGGSLAAGPADTIRVDDYEFTDSVVNTYELRVYAGNVLVVVARATVTPVLGGIWLKSISRPFLNRAVTVVDFSAVTAPARGAVFDVLGRRLPIAVTEVRGSRRYDLVLRAADAAEAQAVELALSFGDTVYVQVPAGCVVPASMHAFVGDVTYERRGRHDTEARYVTLPLTEVDAPAASVVGATITWTGVVSAYPTWADVVAAKATWLDLLSSISAPADETVG